MPRGLDKPGRGVHRSRGADRYEQAGPFQRTQERAAFLPFADAIPAELVLPIACAGTPEEVAVQIRATLAAGADGLMAYLQVPQGETMESVLGLYAEVVAMLRAPAKAAAI